MLYVPEPQTSTAKYALSQQTYNNRTTQLLNSHYAVYKTVPKVVQAYLCQSLFGQFLYVPTPENIQVLSRTAISSKMLRLSSGPNQPTIHS
jgi:hypothetical protein